MGKTRESAPESQRLDVTEPDVPVRRERTDATAQTLRMGRFPTPVGPAPPALDRTDPGPPPDHESFDQTELERTQIEPPAGIQNGAVEPPLNDASIEPGLNDAPADDGDDVDLLMRAARRRRIDRPLLRASSGGAPAAKHAATHGLSAKARTPTPLPSVLIESRRGDPTIPSALRRSPPQPVLSESAASAPRLEAPPSTEDPPAAVHGFEPPHAASEGYRPRRTRSTAAIVAAGAVGVLVLAGVLVAILFFRSASAPSPAISPVPPRTPSASSPSPAVPATSTTSPALPPASSPASPAPAVTQPAAPQTSRGSTPPKHREPPRPVPTTTQHDDYTYPSKF